MADKKNSPPLYESKVKSIVDLEAIELDGQGLRQCDNVGPPIGRRRKSFYSTSYNPEDDLGEVAEKPRQEKSSEVKSKLMSSITSNLLFRSLEPEQLSALIDATSELAVKPGDELVKKGVENDYFFIIDSGEFEIGDDCETKKVECGTFGELSLLHNMPNDFTIRATADGRVFILDKHDYRRIVTRTNFDIRRRLENLIDIVSPLRDLTDNQKMKIADVLELRNFSDGEVVVDESKDPEGLYLVVSGAVEILEKANRWTAAEGEAFGELPETKPSSRFLALARGSSKVAFLRTEAFDRLMGPCLKVSKRKPKPIRRGLPSSSASSEFGDACENV